MARKSGGKHFKLEYLDKDEGWNQWTDEMKSLEAEDVEVGIFAGDRGDKGTYIADYALDNEIGTDKIPSRPWMRSTVDDNRAKYNRAIDRQVDGIADGLRTLAILTKIGELLTNDFQEAITRWKDPPNAPYTIKKKGKDDPLQDTGAMRKSIRYRLIRVVKYGKE